MIDDAKLDKTLALLTKRIPFRLFTWAKMPSGAFVGLRLDRCDEEACVASLPGGWRSQNPMATMYWAAQGMAAELATGAVPFAMVRASGRSVRTFVTGTEATFGKKAKGRIWFTCEDIGRARSALEQTLATGESVECVMTAVGRDAAGDIVSEWRFTWNFRARPAE